MTATTTRPRPRMFDRIADPLTDRKERAEDRFRAAVQHELDAVGRSLRTRAVRIRPSAIAFAAAALVTAIGISLFAVAAVVGLAHVVPLWLSAVVVGAGLLAVAAVAAGWGHRMLPPTEPVIPMPPSTHPAEELVHPWVD